MEGVTERLLHSLWQKLIQMDPKNNQKQKLKGKLENDEVDLSALISQNNLKNSSTVRSIPVFYRA